MPKSNIENAINKSSSKDDKVYEEVVYEGTGIHIPACARTHIHQWSPQASEALQW